MEAFLKQCEDEEGAADALYELLVGTLQEPEEEISDLFETLKVDDNFSYKDLLSEVKASQEEALEISSQVQSLLIEEIERYGGHGSVNVGQKGVTPRYVTFFVS